MPKGIPKKKKVKRIRVEPKKSILHKGKVFFRTAEDSIAHRAELAKYHPRQEDYELVEFMAANNITKDKACEHFGISLNAFNEHFSDNFERGKMRRNLRTTQTLYNAANGIQGIKVIGRDGRTRWLQRPVEANMTALIWWDKTRGGWAETVNKGKQAPSPNINMNTQVLLVIPPNGREVGAKGDPQYIVRKQAEYQARLAADEKAR